MLERGLGSVVALLALSASLGCSSSPEGAEKPRAQESYLGLSSPDDGFQIRTKGVTVRPGDDVEYCEVLEFPGEPGKEYFVSGVEAGNGEGSHHLIIDAVRAGSVAEAKVDAAKLAEPFECL